MSFEFQNGGEDINDADREVGLLIKRSVEKPRTNRAIIEELERKYGSDGEKVKEIMKKLSDRFKEIRKKAEKIAQRLQTKYPHFTKREALEKISEYKSKFHFDDNEMHAIINLIFRRDDRMYPGETFEYGTMSRALGYVPTSHNFIGKINVGDEKEQVELIKGIYNSPQIRDTYNQVVLQSLTFDCNQNMGDIAFDKFKTNVYSHVSPVLFAMFFDRIKCFDETMILASIPRIVTLRDQGQDLETQPDYVLYSSIATDPNEVHCVAKDNKPFTDLLNRSNVQVKIWENVLNLRQSKYYINDMGMFMEALNNCKSNVFDAGDLAFIRDEGTMMRKIMGVFSLRPTVVSTNPMSAGMTNIVPVNLLSVTRVPMLTVRFGYSDPENKVYKLEDALKTEQHYISGRNLISKKQEVLASSAVIIFYVNRRHHSVSLGSILAPYQIGKLPLTVTSHQKVFNATVINNQEQAVGGQTFSRKAVVCVVTTSINNDDDGTLTENLIIGTSASVRVNGTNYARYEPIGLSRPLSEAGSAVALEKIYPLTQTNAEEIADEFNTKGTVYIYTTEDNLTFNNILGSS